MIIAFEKFIALLRVLYALVNAKPDALFPLLCAKLEVANVRNRDTEVNTSRVLNRSIMEVTLLSRKRNAHKCLTTQKVGSASATLYARQ